MIPAPEGDARTTWPLRKNDARPTSRTIPALIRWHGYAALACVLYVALLGLVMSIKLHAPDWLGGVPWLSWGRLRYAHTQGLFFGWLGNAFLAFLYFAVPRLAGRPVTGVRLGWALFAVWNGLLVLPGWALVQAGVSQPLEWAEFPLPVDGAATLGMLLAVVQFVVPLLRARVSSLYVSAWYILGGLTFTLLAYPVGNVVPEYLPGAQGATFSGLWIHDAVGLFVTPLALAIAYAVIPAVSRRPIYSHFLSMIGFWLLFLIYPLNGTHHYVFSSIPMEAQKGAVVASVYLGADVVLVVTNLLLSLRGPVGHGRRRHAAAVRLGRDGRLPDRQPPGLGPGDHAGQSIRPLLGLGDRPLAPGDDRVRLVHGPGRPAARLAADAGVPVQPRGGGLVVLAARPGPGGDGPRPDRRRAWSRGNSGRATCRGWTRCGPRPRSGGSARCRASCSWPGSSPSWRR